VAPSDARRRACLKRMFRRDNKRKRDLLEGHLERSVTAIGVSLAGIFFPFLPEMLRVENSSAAKTRKRPGAAKPQPKKMFSTG